MPSYCTNCGAQLQGAFCGACGQRASSPSGPVTPAAPAAPPKNTGAGKALLIIGGIFLVTAIAGTAYAVHWVKKKAIARISPYASGVLGSSARQLNVARGQACAMLPREDVQRATGVAIERVAEIMEGSYPGCAYYTNPESFTRLQRMAVEQSRKDAEAAQGQPPPKSDNPLELLKDVNKLEGIVKAIGLTQAEKDGRLFSFTIDREFGRSNWPTLRATVSVVPGFEELPGVGDAAIMGSFGHAVYVIKGDSMIHLETTFLPEARVVGAELGRKIASGL